MMNKIFISMLVLMCFSLVLAQDEGLPSAGVGRQNQSFDLRETSPNSTYVNVTSISYPNQTTVQLNPNYRMTKVGTDYKAKFNDTMQIGDYNYCIKTDLDGGVETPCIAFTITPSGFLNTLGFHILILIISLGVIVLGFSIKDPITLILGSFGLGFVGLYSLLYGIDGMKDTAYTYAFSIITIMLGAYISIRASMDLIED